MSKTKIKLYLSVVILAIVSFFLVADLFFIQAKPQTFDGWTHLITIEKFSQALDQGNIPVSWVDGVANYGYPLGQVAHQTTSYVGAGINLLLANVTLSYALVWFIGAFLSSVFFYLWLRFYVKDEAALVGAILFNFAPYRILNVYVRSAVPEFFASVWIALSLIGIHLWMKSKSWWGLVIVILSVCFLVLTHPMMLIPWSILVGFYLLFLLGFNLSWVKLKQVLLLAGAVIWGLVLSSYYLGPLLLEMKFFYYAGFDLTKMPFEYLMPEHFIFEKWNFVGVDSIGIRENRKQLGTIEFASIIIGFGYILHRLVGKKSLKSQADQLLSYLVLASAGLMILASPWSSFLFRNSQLIAGLQHPWRLLTALSFLPPAVMALLIDKSNHKFWLVVSMCLLIGWLRFPQLYGRNYIRHTPERYDFSIENLHSTNMNTIWTGSTLDYPVVSEKIEILEGQAEISNKKTSFVARGYRIKSDQRVRMVDRTFYFPGWTLLVDGNQQPIEFQDPSYRGVITYWLEPGEHQVSLVFKDTKVRLLFKLLSIIGAVSFLAMIAVVWKLEKQLTTFFLKSS